MTNFNQIFQSALVEVESSNSTDSIEKIRVKYFGKNGIINDELRKLANLDQDKKREVGKTLNNFKNRFFDEIQSKKKKLKIK